MTTYRWRINYDNKNDRPPYIERLSLIVESPTMENALEQAHILMSNDEEYYGIRILNIEQIGVVTREKIKNWTIPVSKMKDFVADNDYPDARTEGLNE